MHVTVNFFGLFFRTGKIFFGLTRFSCLSVRMTYVNASQFVCVFYVNTSHSVCECHGGKILQPISTYICKCWYFCECPGERIIANLVSIFVNAGHFVNILEKELLQPMYSVIFVNAGHFIL